MALSLKIKAYYHFVPEFQNVSYDGYTCSEENGVKVITGNEEEISTFIGDNGFSLTKLRDKKLLTKGENIFGEVVKQDA